REARARELERHARARARLEEEIDDHLAAKRGNLLHASPRHFAEALGGIEDLDDLVAGELFEPEEMPPCPNGGAIGRETVARRRTRRRVAIRHTFRRVHVSVLYPSADSGPISRSTASSGSPSSRSDTTIRSDSRVGTVSATWFASIGSSRLPRSTRTDSQVRFGRPKSRS